MRSKSKITKHEKVHFNFIRGAMLFLANPTEAKPYYLYSSFDNTGQKDTRGSRMPKRPLSIDLADHVITVPNQVLGCTLILMGENGEEYVYFLSNNTINLPKSLEGEFELQITNGTITYTGKLYL